MTTAAIESLITPLDAARARLFRALGPLTGVWARDRDARVLVMGIATIVVALATTVVAPLWMLALGPIVLGVPHIVADLRYLWVQPGHHRRRAIWVLVVPSLAAGAITGDVYWGVLGAALALFAVPTSTARRAIGLAVLVPLFAVSLHWQAASALAFAHLHNVLALALWWAIRPRRRASSSWVVVAFVVASAALMVGLFDGLVASMVAWLEGPGAARPLAGYARSLAPMVGPELGSRIVLLFAFAQSVHYGIWLRLVPEDARDRPSPRTFRSSYRALVADLGVFLLAGAALCALALAVWAMVDLAHARAGYLRFAIFHGHLELAAGALLFAGVRAKRCA